MFLLDPKAAEEPSITSKRQYVEGSQTEPLDDDQSAIVVDNELRKRQLSHAPVSEATIPRPADNQRVSSRRTPSGFGNCACGCFKQADPRYSCRLDKCPLFMALDCAKKWAYCMLHVGSDCNPSKRRKTEAGKLHFKKTEYIIQINTRLNCI